LDKLTGDYYSFNKQDKQWIPKGNVGLHYSYAEASFFGENSRGTSS
jgi:hypothetical protein